MANPTYSTGTVSISASGTTVTGVGTIWSGVNAKAGDTIYIGTLGGVRIKDVTDATHLTLWSPWAGGAQSGVAYTIVQDYPARVVGVAAAEDVGVMLGQLNSLGPIFNVPTGASAPDPSYGIDGQYAHQMVTNTWWLKTSGAWVVSGPPTSSASLTAVNAFTNTTEATGAGTTFAARFAGGVEIAKKLFVTGIATLSSYLSLGARTGTLGEASHIRVYDGGDAASSYGFGVDAGGTFSTNSQVAHAWYLNGTTQIMHGNATRINIPLTTPSTTSATGALTVAGGVGIAGALTVGGALSVTGTVSMSSTTASTSTTTGALKVAGGLGVGGALNSAYIKSTSTRAWIDPTNSKTPSQGDFAVMQVGDGASNGLQIFNSTNTHLIGWLIGADTNAYLAYDAVVVGRFTTTTGAYTALSDRDLKKSIVGYDRDAWDIVKRGVPVSYLMKTQGDDERRNLGFVAQDMAVLVPEAVTTLQTDGSDPVFGLEYTALIPVLWRALQLAQERIEALATRVVALEAH